MSSRLLWGGWVVGPTIIGPEEFAAAGGMVLTDPATTVKIEGSRRIRLEFPNLVQHLEGLKEKVRTPEALALERRDEVVQRELFAPFVESLRAEIRKSLTRDYTVSAPGAVVREQRCGDSRYYFVVNNCQTLAFHRGLNYELQPAAVRLTLRDFRALYDVQGGAPIQIPRIKGQHPGVDLTLPAGGLDIVADLPEVVGGVVIKSLRHKGDQLDINAFVFGGKREKTDWWEFASAVQAIFAPPPKPKPLSGAVPIEVTLLDPDGTKVLHLYRAHVPAGYRESLPFPAGQKPGEWKVVIRERLSGTSAEATFRVRSAPPAWAAMNRCNSPMTSASSPNPCACSSRSADWPAGVSTHACNAAISARACAS